MWLNSDHLMDLFCSASYQGCARFADFLQIFNERQILLSLCWVVFYALTLKLPIQTLLYVANKLLVYTRSGEKCENFSKTSSSQQLQPLHYSRGYSEVRAVLFFVPLINTMIDSNASTTLYQSNFEQRQVFLPHIPNLIVQGRHKPGSTQV